MPSMRFLVFCVLVALADAGKIANLSHLPIAISEKDLKIAELNVFFFTDQRFEATKLFTTAELVLKYGGADQTTNFRVYQSPNSSLIQDYYAADHQWFGLFRRFQLWNSMKLFPFADTYVGVVAESPYDISFRITVVDFTLLFLFIAGIALIFSAMKLSRNVAFHYGSGVSLGVLASFLVILFIVYRSIPKRSVGLSFLLGGSSIVLWAFYSLWQNLYSSLMNYQSIISIYLVTTSFVSFAIMYRVGPPTDIRTLNLLQWSLQAAGCMLINCGCQSREIAACVIIICILTYNFPQSVMNWAYRNWRFYHPEPRRLLTDREFREQGVHETERSLRALRTYCQSPEASPWKIMSTVKDKARMTDFVQNSVHLREDELRHHEDLFDGMLFDDVTDDESDSIGRRVSRNGSRSQTGSRLANNRNRESALIEDLLFTDDEGDLNVMEVTELAQQNQTESLDVTADFQPSLSGFLRHADGSEDSEEELVVGGQMPSTSGTARYRSSGLNGSCRNNDLSAMVHDPDVTDDEEEFFPPALQRPARRRREFGLRPDELFEKNRKPAPGDSSGPSARPIGSSGVAASSHTKASACASPTGAPPGSQFTKTRIKSGLKDNKSFNKTPAAYTSPVPGHRSQLSSPYHNSPLVSLNSADGGSPSRYAQLVAGAPNGRVVNSPDSFGRQVPRLEDGSGVRIRNVHVEEQDSDE